ncbi:hypothetical protein FKW77_009641 [Venturia effusa]|uniref:Uncharacterized protein n=1 Tax=Venturia effusa TaxID=50376 RepID=A0A517L652_9PEZI|nr:hypothetical protein FKW77_009641 [Venturia effusa]
MLFKNALIAIAALSSSLGTVLACPLSAASTSLVKRKGYSRPSVFKRTFKKGEGVIAAMLSPPNPAETFPNSEYNLKKYGGKAFVEHVLPGAIPIEMAKPAQKFGWDLNHAWKHVNWYVNKGDSHVSETAFDEQSRTLVSLVENDYPLMKILVKKKDTQLPYRSELWSNTWEPELMAMKGDLRYIMSLNIQNEDTRPIISAVRKLLNPGLADDQPVLVERESGDIKQRESFVALAGTDNGAPMFRMLTDRHNLFGNRKIERVWVWGAKRGQCEEYHDFCNPTIVWEIG